MGRLGYSKDLLRSRSDIILTLARRTLPFCLRQKRKIMEGYKRLASFILATVICDLTVDFINRWISSKSRTRDQMEQAARSGKQNIAEGYTVQSLESYIKLCGVALTDLLKN